MLEDRAARLAALEKQVEDSAQRTKNLPLHMWLCCSLVIVAVIVTALASYLMSLAHIA